MALFKGHVIKRKKLGNEIVLNRCFPWFLVSYWAIRSSSNNAELRYSFLKSNIGFPMFSPSIVSSLLTFIINGSIHSMNREHDRASPCFTDCSMSILSVLYPFTNISALRFLFRSLTQLKSG